MTLDWHTDTEIAAQPGIWRVWTKELPKIAGDIRAWIEDRKPDVIWLCGAGTSAFIGDSVAVAVEGKILGIPVRAIPSTDLVARPFDYLNRGARPLVVSFGRSGNSSETIGTLDLLSRHAPDADRLHITCNAESALAAQMVGGPGEQRVITLPGACHDKGFAMTSSYTTMLMTALACLDDCAVDQIADKLARLAAGAEQLFETIPALPRPARAVFLGTGPFLGTARESSLKVLELTAGKVVTSWDSTLGFRHGPKAIVDDDTAVIIYLSSDLLTRKYDQDIVSEIRTQFPQSRVVSVGATLEDTAPPDVVINGCNTDIWNTPIYVLVAQVLAVAWSKSLSLNVDNPFEGGNLTRVVSNVRLYA
jgi:fructoselysine-6-P-deglycase FrlB-like protein